jgi:hypothetical protein
MTRQRICRELCLERPVGEGILGPALQRAVKDLREWANIGECGRTFVEQEPGMAVHTDGAEQGWGATFGPDAGTRAKGIWGNLGTWTARESKESIALRY